MLRFENLYTLTSLGVVSLSNPALRGLRENCQTHWGRSATGTPVSSGLLKSLDLAVLGCPEEYSWLVVTLTDPYTKR